MKIISMAALVVVVLASTLLQSTYAVTYTVGDSTGWTVPSNTEFYDEWADNKTFAVGDVLGEFLKSNLVKFVTWIKEVGVFLTKYDPMFSQSLILRPDNMMLPR